MDQRTRYIAIGAVAFIIILAIVGIIFFMGNRVDETDQGSLDSLPSLSTETTPVPSDTTVPIVPNSADTKLYLGNGFSLEYPKSWGLLSCNNSQNFEFDPINPSDQPQFVCNYAVKPITFLQETPVNCTGETVKIGEHIVMKSKTTKDTYVTYRWCLNVGGKGLDITHRVAPSGQATSTKDYSQDVENIIKTIRVTPQGS